MREILNSFKASNVFQELEVSEDIDARCDDFLPMNALKPYVCIVLLEREVQGFKEVYIRSFHSMNSPFVCHLELVLVEILWEHFHYQ